MRIDEFPANRTQMSVYKYLNARDRRRRRRRRCLGTGSRRITVRLEIFSIVVALLLSEYLRANHSVARVATLSAC